MGVRSAERRREIEKLGQLIVFYVRCLDFFAPLRYRLSVVSLF